MRRGRSETCPVLLGTCESLNLQFFSQTPLSLILSNHTQQRSFSRNAPSFFRHKTKFSEHNPNRLCNACFRNRSQKDRKNALFGLDSPIFPVTRRPNFPSQNESRRQSHYNQINAKK